MLEVKKGPKHWSVTPCLQFDHILGDLGQILTLCARVANGSDNQHSGIADTVQNLDNGRFNETQIVSERGRDDVRVTLKGQDESLHDVVGCRKRRAAEDFVRTQTDSRSHTDQLGPRTSKNTSNMRAMAIAVHGITIGLNGRRIGRVEVRSNNVVAGLNTEARAEATAQGRMVVVHSAVDDGNDNIRAIETPLVHLEDVGEEVGVEPLEVGAGHDGGIIVVGPQGRVALGRGQAVDLNGPHAGDLAEALDACNRLGRGVGKVERGAVEDVRSEVQSGGDGYADLLDRFVEAFGVLWGLA